MTHKDTCCISSSIFWKIKIKKKKNCLYSKTYEVRGRMCGRESWDQAVLCRWKYKPMATWVHYPAEHTLTKQWSNMSMGADLENPRGFHKDCSSHQKSIPVHGSESSGGSSKALVDYKQHPNILRGPPWQSRKDWQWGLRGAPTELLNECQLASMFLLPPRSEWVWG